MDLYASLFQKCGDAIVIFDDHLNVAYVNDQAQALLGETMADGQDVEALSRCLVRQQLPSGTTDAGLPLRQIAQGLILNGADFILTSSQGQVKKQLSITGSPCQMPSFGAPGVLLIVRDVSRGLSAAPAAAVEMRDELTGLVNRTVFMDRIEHALDRTQRNKKALIAILCLDVKRLKAVNDALGYAAGDELLVAIAQRLTQVLRPEDTLSRLGGDEFMLLVEDVGSFSAVEAIVDTLRAALIEPFAIQGHDITVQVNIGISLGNYASENADGLLRQADIAMHRTKNNFGERYCVFEDSMKADSDSSLYLEMALKKAIERQELFLEYQPIFLVRTQEVIGFEALVRWNHPEEGLLSPSRFISIAETTGLIIPLGWWVMAESCRQLKAWQETIPSAQPLFVSVNMSGKQFAQRDVLERLQSILQQTKLDPTSLKIEITEGVLIENSSTILQTLKAIRQMGIKLSVDDFGTGYSSLSYLHQFPVDTLKIDRSFLENADSDFEKLEILQSVVRLAWNLGLEVVAEGIETQRHFAQIKALRCESGQGFLFSRPLGQQAMEAMLRQQAE